MERLTWHNGEYWTQVQTQKVGTTKVGYKAICAKLAAYEDTGLGPEEVTTILRRTAERDKAMGEGRLVELPCKQYTTVYYLLDKRVFVGWYLAQVGETTHLILQDRIETGSCWVTDGAWFLTRQEAEAALDGGGEGG